MEKKAKLVEKRKKNNRITVAFLKEVISAGRMSASTEDKEYLEQLVDAVEKQLKDRYERYCVGLYDDVKKDHTSASSLSVHPLVNLQLHFYKWGINVDLIKEAFSHGSMTVIGEYFEKLDEWIVKKDPITNQSIQTICSFSDDKVNKMKKMNRLIRIYNMDEPTPGDRIFVKNEGNRVCRDYMTVFDRKPFPYMHAISTHMADDLLKYGTLRYFRCDLMENLNGVIKRIIDRYTNKKRGDNSYLEQAMKRYLFTMYVCKKYGHLE